MKGKKMMKAIPMNDKARRGKPSMKGKAMKGAPSPVEGGKGAKGKLMKRLEGKEL